MLLKLSFIFNFIVQSFGFCCALFPVSILFDIRNMILSIVYPDSLEKLRLGLGLIFTSWSWYLATSVLLIFVLVGGLLFFDIYD